MTDLTQLDEIINSYVKFRDNLTEEQRQLITLIQMPKITQKEICKLMQFNLSTLRKKIVEIKRQVNLEHTFKISELVEYLRIMDAVQTNIEDVEVKQANRIIIPTHIGGGRYRG